jgi:hypothetical protein
MPGSLDRDNSGLLTPHRLFDTAGWEGRKENIHRF